MFTTGAFALTTLLAWFAYRKNEQERSTYYKAGDQGLPLLVDIRFDDERGKPEREIAAHRLYGVERDAFSGAGGAADIALVDICEKRLCSRPTAGESRQHVIPATSISTIAYRHADRRDERDSHHRCGARGQNVPNEHVLDGKHGARRSGYADCNSPRESSDRHFLARRSPRSAGAMPEWAGACVQHRKSLGVSAGSPRLCPGPPR